MGEIPKAVAKRIVRNAGGKDVRVSDGAAVQMVDYLEEMGAKLSNRAIEVAEHAGRKTVKDSDIKWASIHM